MAEILIVDLPENITKTDLETIGAIDSSRDQYGAEYQFIRRSSKPIGILHHASIILKLYHMLRETEPLPKHLVEGLESFIITEIETGNVERHQGTGFAILSQGFLSINMWGRGNVLFTQTYTVEGTYPELSRKTLERTGVACTWEQKIMSHEYNLWHQYITSHMGIEDKLTYLKTFISGELQDGGK